MSIFRMMITKAHHILLALLFMGLASATFAQSPRPSAFIADLETTWSEWQQDAKRMEFWKSNGWVFEETIKELQDRNAPWWPLEDIPWADGELSPEELPEGVEPDALHFQTWNVPGGTFHLLSLVRLETLFARSNQQR